MRGGHGAFRGACDYSKCPIKTSQNFRLIANGFWFRSLAIHRTPSCFRVHDVAIRYLHPLRDGRDGKPSLPPPPHLSAKPVSLAMGTRTTRCLGSFRTRRAAHGHRRAAFAARDATGPLSSRDARAFFFFFLSLFLFYSRHLFCPFALSSWRWKVNG